MRIQFRSAGVFFSMLMMCISLFVGTAEATTELNDMEQMKKELNTLRKKLVEQTLEIEEMHDEIERSQSATLQLAKNVGSVIDVTKFHSEVLQKLLGRPDTN